MVVKSVSLLIGDAFNNWSNFLIAASFMSLFTKVVLNPLTFCVHSCFVPIHCEQ